MNRDCIIFDLDGTLYKSEDTFVPAIQNALRVFGLPAEPPEKILPLLRFSAQGYSKSLLKTEDPGIIEPFRKTVRDYEMASIPVLGTLFPGVRETIIALRDDGWNLAVCTNAGSEYLEAVLKKTEIGEYFTYALGNDSGRPKTESVGKLLALISAKAEQSVLVGDSDSDEKAARENGIPFIEASWGYGNAEIVKPDIRIGSILELTEALRRLSQSTAGF